MLSGPFSYSHPIRQQYTMAYNKLYLDRAVLLKWGSGLICGEKAHLSQFMKCCIDVYELMRKNAFCEDDKLGDEFITSVAALKSGEPIVDGKPYMNVYWTNQFYLVSTDYHYDKMVWLHLPDEKERGLMDIFFYYKKHGELPKSNLLYGYLNLPHLRKPVIRYYINCIRRRLLK